MEQQTEIYDGLAAATGAIDELTKYGWFVPSMVSAVWIADFETGKDRILVVYRKAEE